MTIQHNLETFYKARLTVLSHENVNRLRRERMRASSTDNPRLQRLLAIQILGVWHGLGHRSLPLCYTMQAEPPFCSSTLSARHQHCDTDSILPYMHTDTAA